MSVASKEAVTAESLIASAPLFRGVDRAALRRLAAACVPVSVARGALLFRRGDPCDGFHVVISGQVKLVLQTEGGDEKIIELVGPGNSFGEAIALSEHAYPIAARAIGESALLHIAKGALQAEVARAPAFARRIIASLSEGVLDLLLRHEGVTLRSGTQRVVAYLLEECGEPIAHETTVQLRAKKGVIASQLNLTHEHFSRILRELARQGLIAVNGRVVRLIDTAALRDRLN